jgi:hypothetical protein
LIVIYGISKSNTKKHKISKRIKMESSEWVTFKDFAKINKHLFSVPTLRKILHNRKENGLHVGVRKVGKLLLISQKKFEQWIDKQK